MQIRIEKNEITISRFINIILWIIILTGLVEAVWGLLQLYGFRRGFNSNFKITGSFFNPAPYAIYLAVIFPLALGMLLDSEKIDFKLIKKITRSRRPLVSAISKQLFVRYISLATVIAIVLLQ